VQGRGIGAFTRVLRRAIPRPTDPSNWGHRDNAARAHASKIPLKSPHRKWNLNVIGFRWQVRPMERTRLPVTMDERTGAPPKWELLACAPS
jgi:hypothetical protein